MFLKLTSFLLRFSQENQQKLYPLAMNFMFFELEETEAKIPEVRVYPAERGVHNQIDYDQTKACGTGSTCLGTHLLHTDTRFAHSNTIQIENRSGVVLEIRMDVENSFLMGQAGKTQEKNTTTEVPFTAQVFLENFGYYNPNGEDDLNELAGETINTPLEIFHTVRKLLSKELGDGNNPPCITTTDHPNPKGFLDWYTILSYLNSIYIANQLKLELYRTALDTTGTRGQDYPSSEKFNNLEIPILQTVNLEKWKPNSSTLYAYLLELIKDNLHNHSQITNKIKGKEGKFVLKKLLDENERNLLVALEKTLSDVILNSIKNLDLDNLDSKENMNDEEKKELYLADKKESFLMGRDAIREGVILNCFKKATLKYLAKIAELLKKSRIIVKNNQIIGISKDTMVNLFQNFLKGELNDVIFKLAATPEQKLKLQKAGVIDENRDYITPELQSLSKTSEVYKKIIITLLENQPNLLSEYLKYALDKTNQNKITLCTIENQELSFERDKGFSYNKQIVANETEVARLLQNSSQVSINAIIEVGPINALGMIHHFGSERNYRTMFLDFLVSKYSNTKHEDLIKRIKLANLGLVCPDYNPSNYGHEVPVPPDFPIATDNQGNGNPFSHYRQEGVAGTKEALQSLLRDSNRKTK